MSAQLEVPIEIIKSEKPIPKNGLIPTMIKLLAKPNIDGYYDQNDVWVPFGDDQAFEVIEFRSEESPAGARRYFCARMQHALVRLDIFGKNRERKLKELPIPPAKSVATIMEFVRRTGIGYRANGGQASLLTEGTSLPAKEKGPKKPKPKPKVKEEPSAPSFQWIPQLKQFVKIKGRHELFILNDYDAYDEVFILTFADARQVEHAPSRMTYVKAKPSDLEPFILTY